MLMEVCRCRTKFVCLPRDTLDANQFPDVGFWIRLVIYSPAILNYQYNEQFIVFTGKNNKFAKKNSVDYRLQLQPSKWNLFSRIKRVEKARWKLFETPRGLIAPANERNVCHFHFLIFVMQWLLRRKWKQFYRRVSAGIITLESSKTYILSAN